MALIIAALLVLVFAANVVIGSVAGAPILGNVEEMLLLFGASISFVTSVLKKEAERDAAKENQD
ncbi:hypothetical protein [Boseongicola aestuarii]|uniref:Uncharacterized protein n=1 Tax=Boseongicola aestuarii TaxID=1470561 RepID=A0A238J0M6_9RHOB|nr:hypothetical protein [Boseongicola aestuarii]SMX23873.1 hypothetical protein BOA8489_01986 [Boseongicola aestuarii]